MMRKTLIGLILVSTIATTNLFAQQAKHAKVYSKGIVQDRKIALAIGKLLLRSKYSEIPEDSTFDCAESNGVFTVRARRKGAPSLGGAWRIRIQRTDCRVIEIVGEE